MSDHVYMDIFSQHFRSEKFADCRIICGDRVWNLHRIVLCSRSKFFEAAFDGGFEESRTQVITLTDQDPDVVDNALEYLYTGQLRECYVETFHEHEVDSKNVMASLDLHAYRELVPLYRLADFLGLDLLCSKIVLTLTEVNRHLAPRLQRLSKFNVPLDENFKAGLTRCAELAYGVLIRQSEEGQTGRSGNIRSVFVDLFDLARYRPLNDTLDWLVESAPRLLADILIRIQQREKVGACLDVENFDATAPAAGSTRWMLK